MPKAEFTSIDTLVPFYETSQLFRSVGFRWKRGPLIRRLNDFVLERVGSDFYDLIWVDKAVFLTEPTTAYLRARARKLVHFTPDPAFTFHHSKHFEWSLRHYDMLVTTKSYEVDDYASRVDRQRLILVTQGYDSSQHYSRRDFGERIPGVCFIGHHESSRQEIIEAMLQMNVPTFIAGRGWGRFAKKHSRNRNLIYGGPGVYGYEYAERLSEYKFGLGLLSEWIPEKHTTRTFEIPACGSVLITERNSETEEYFDEDEVLFFSSEADLLYGLRYLLEKPEEAEKISLRGVNRVRANGFDYKSIMLGILASVNGKSS